MMNTILFPSSYFSDGKIDEDLKKEYNAALETELFSVVLFSYDKWFNEGILKLEVHTIDYAELENGEWKILEAGDGQVSGLSDFQDYNAYFRALYYCING